MAVIVVRLGAALIARGMMVSTAESCTGGLIAAALTEAAGSSAWFDRGFVTYSNAAKMEMLGVTPTTLERHGAVSEATAREMAMGALSRSDATLTVAVTGVAGPGGGSADKPVGTVCFGWAQRDGRFWSTTAHLAGDRYVVRQASVSMALEGLYERATNG